MEFIPRTCTTRASGIRQLRSGRASFEKYRYRQWAQVISTTLKPGGTFFIAMTAMFAERDPGEDISNGLRLSSRFQAGSPMT